MSQLLIKAKLVVLRSVELDIKEVEELEKEAFYQSQQPKRQIRSHGNRAAKERNLFFCSLKNAFLGQMFFIFQKILHQVITVLHL